MQSEQKSLQDLQKELQVAVRGGTDPSSNPRLRSALLHVDR